MTRQGKQSADDAEALWRKNLIQGHTSTSIGRRLMRWLPGPPRCKVCNNPFGGVGGLMCRAIGMTPSKKNPRICALCCEHLPRGGAEVEIAILFADVRGSTALAERLGPTAFAATLNRFYNTATEALIRRDAVIDKLIGDEVMAFFVPGFAGPDYARAAIDAGRDLIGKLGYGSVDGPWLPVGIGIDAGIAFVGNVGGEEVVDFTALGDPVNTAAGIQAQAASGEILVSEAALAAGGFGNADWPQRQLEVKGKAQPLAVRVMPVEAAA